MSSAIASTGGASDAASIEGVGAVLDVLMAPKRPVVQDDAAWRTADCVDEVLLVLGRSAVPAARRMARVTSLSEFRRWDVAAVEWHRVATLLDQGWEPFAVVQREPNSDRKSTAATVYLRRERQDENV